MKRTLLLFVALTLLVVTAHRLPAPIKEIPESPTPEPIAPAATSAENDYKTAWQYAEGMNEVQINGARAVEFLRRAAEQHLPEAEADLAAWMKFAGPDIYVPSKKGEAEELAHRSILDGLQLRAERGEPRAEEALARLCMLGLGVPRDGSKAEELYRKAAEQGNPAAQHALALLYQNGTAEIPKDLIKAIEFYQKAIDQGYADSEYSLGLTYKSSLMKPANYRKAAGFLQRAVDQGHLYAPTDLGGLYERGAGVRKDLKKAAEIYRKGAEKGNGPAREHLRRLERITAAPVHQE